MSDLIALGVVMATGACGGPHVELKGGRIDATAAGPSGVPQPETNLQTTLTEFASANFNQDDTIALTACGHTMGGVHRAQFPQVVGPNATGTSGTDGRQPFDETVGGFDAAVVTDYVHWTGDRGGPLVTTPNKTVQSDLRLYASDNNQTITRLAQSTTYFQSQCAAVFQRMIETVPGSVRLTPAVDPTTTTNLKPYGVYLSIDWAGNMVLTGYLRYVQVAGAPTAPSSLTITLVNRAGKTTSTSVKAPASSGDTGSGIYGPTKSYPFTLKFSSAVGVSGISTNGQTFPLQDTMFVSPSLSSIRPTPQPFSTDSSAMGVTYLFIVNTTVAYLPPKGSTAPATLTATYAIPEPQPGTVSPKIDTSTTVQLTKVGSVVGGYAVYSGKLAKEFTLKQAYGSSVDVGVVGQSAGVQFFKPFVANA